MSRFASLVLLAVAVALPAAGQGFKPSRAIELVVHTGPGMPPDAMAYWVDFFSRMAQTPSWKKYLEDNLFEDGFQRGAELAKFMEQFPEQIRGILTDAGVKVVR